MKKLSLLAVAALGLTTLSVLPASAAVSTALTVNSVAATGGTTATAPVALPVPADKELYARIVSEAKRKFDVYPSAVANAWVVQEYKRRGGKYKSGK